jgi:hypothetical protein
MKIHPVVAELFRVDGQADTHDKANSRFSQFYEGAQKLPFDI